MTQEADTRSLALSTAPHQRPAFWKRLIAGLLMLTINVSSFAQAVSPVLGGGGRPYSGYTKDGTLVQGGQVVGNPHQSLHDLQNPALWTTAAVAFSNTTDPSFTQAILGDIESTIAVTPEPGGLALARLYLTPTNPYADANTGAAGCDAATTCNQAVYNQILLDAAATGYVATASGTHLGKTHDSSSAEIFNRGFNLYQEKPVFLAAQDPLGGATAFFALQGEQAKTHLQHLQTQNVSLLGGTIFFSQQTIKGPGNGSTSHWDGSINDPGAAFDAALGSAPSVNASAGSGGFVVGYIQPDGQAHEFNLQRDSHFQDFQRQQGYGEWGGYGNTDSALGQNLRTAGLQNQKGQQAAAGIDFGYFQEDRSLFLQGLDLYKFGNRGDNGLLQQLQNGQIGPGHPDYERARALAEERFKLAYASQVEYNTKAHFTAEAAKYQADQLDLAAYDNGKLFKSGLNLYDKRGDPEQERLLKLLENGELKPDHPRYAEIRGLAEARYKVAYAKALEPPKKGSWLKTLAAVVIAAVVVYFTAGAASGWAAAGISGATATSATGAVVVAGTAGTAATVGGIAATAIGSAVGAYAGAVISAGIQTGSLNKALKAGENSFKGGVAGIIVNTAVAAMGLTVGNVGGALGVSESVANAVVNTVTGAVSSTIVQGGDLGKNLLSGAVNNTLDVISANVADYIGANTAVGSFEKYASHTLLGCGVGMAKSGSGDGCVPAATGAVIGHLSADSVKVALSDKDPGLLANIFNAAPGKTLNDNVTFVSGLIGGSAAVLVGDKDQTQGNFGLGQASAENAVKNNYLKHDELKKLQAELADCRAKPGGCTPDNQQKIEDKYTETSRANARALAECKSTECVGTHQQAIIEASKAGPDPLGQVSSIELAANQDRADRAVQQQYQIVQQIEQGRKEMDAFIASTCKGLSQSACTTKLEQSQETANKIKDIAAGFTPAGIALDIRDFVTDPSIGSALMIVAGPVGDAVKLVKNAGSVANKVDDEISALNRIRDNATGPNLSGKDPDAILNLQASKKVGQVTVPIDFDGHILKAELKPNGSVVGGHSVVTGDVRVIPGTAGTPNAQGVYDAKIEVRDPANPGSYLPKTNNKGVSTMFPDHWTGDRIKVEVDAAYQNRQLFKHPKSGASMWSGTTPSGVKVEGYLSPNTTVYPIK